MAVPFLGKLERLFLDPCLSEYPIYGGAPDPERASDICYVAAVEELQHLLCALTSARRRSPRDVGFYTLEFDSHRSLYLVQARSQLGHYLGQALENRVDQVGVV